MATEYTLAELSASAGIPARTIRDYQRRGLLPRPQIRGRLAWYRDVHRERLALISELKGQGLTLASISALLAQEAPIAESLKRLRKRAAEVGIDSDEFLPLDPVVLSQLRALDVDVVDTLERLGLIVKRGQAQVASADAMALIRQLITLGLRTTEMRRLLSAIQTLISSLERSTARLDPDEQDTAYAIVRSLLDRAMNQISAARR